MSTGMSTADCQHPRTTRDSLSHLEAPVGIEPTNSRFAVTVRCDRICDPSYCDPIGCARRKRPQIHESTSVLRAHMRRSTTMMNDAITVLLRSSLALAAGRPYSIIARSRDRGGDCCPGAHA